jgi:hypothetical protein
MSFESLIYGYIDFDLNRNRKEIEPFDNLLQAAHGVSAFLKPGDMSCPCSSLPEVNTICQASMPFLARCPFSARPVQQADARQCQCLGDQPS